MIQGTRDIFRIQGYSAINDTELQDTSYRIQDTEQGYWDKRDRQYSFMQPYSLYNINYLNLINNYFSLCVMFIVCQLEELVLESQVLELMNFSVLNWQNFGNQTLSKTKTLCFSYRVSQETLKLIYNFFSSLFNAALSRESNCSGIPWFKQLTLLVAGF